MSNRAVDLILLAVYLILSLLVLLWLKDHLTSADTFNYLMISEKIIEGDWWRAVSGHWGILTSLCLVPFIAAGIKPILAFKIFNWLLSILALHFYIQIINKRLEKKWLRLLSIVLAFPMLMVASMMLTSDMLLITFGLLYFSVILREDYFRSSNTPYLAGLAGGLMYLSKSYGLPFFLAHFTLIYFINYARENPKRFKKSVLHYMKGAGTFLIVSVGWILILSIRFSGFTTGTSGEYNIALMGSERNGLQVTKDELIDPRTEFTDIWAYQEPSHFVGSWSPFQSRPALRHYLNQLKINASSIYYIPFMRDSFIVLLVLLLMLKFTGGNLESADRIFLIYLLSGILIFTLGYWLLIIRPRYLWLNFFLLLPAIWILLERLLNSLVKPVAGFLVVAISVLVLINSFVAFNTRVEHKQFFTQLKSLEHQIDDNLLEGKNVAIIDIPKDQHLMEADAYLMYKKRFLFWGQPFKSSLEKGGTQMLAKQGIDYFILWKNDDLVKSVFSKSELVFENKEMDFKIFKISRIES